MKPLSPFPYPLSPRHRRGLTLIEAMVVMVILSIVGVAVAVGLQSVSRIPTNNDRMLSVYAEIASEIDTWRANAFGPSPWPASLPYSVSDTVTISIGGQSKTFTRTTSIQTWTPASFTTNSSPQPDFVRILITIDGQTGTLFLSSPI